MSISTADQQLADSVFLDAFTKLYINNKNRDAEAVRLFQLSVRKVVGKEGLNLAFNVEMYSMCSPSTSWTEDFEKHLKSFMATDPAKPSLLFLNISQSGSPPVWVQIRLKYGCPQELLNYGDQSVIAQIQGLFEPPSSLVNAQRPIVAEHLTHLASSLEQLQKLIQQFPLPNITDDDVFCPSHNSAYNYSPHGNVLPPTTSSCNRMEQSNECPYIFTIATITKAFDPKTAVLRVPSLLTKSIKI